MDSSFLDRLSNNLFSSLQPTTSVDDLLDGSFLDLLFDDHLTSASASPSLPLTPPEEDFRSFTGRRQRRFAAFPDTNAAHPSHQPSYLFDDQGDSSSLSPRIYLDLEPAFQQLSPPQPPVLPAALNDQPSPRPDENIL